MELLILSIAFVCTLTGYLLRKNAEKHRTEATRGLPWNSKEYWTISPRKLAEQYDSMGYRFELTARAFFAVSVVFYLIYLIYF